MSFLKDIFGPSQREVWMELAKSVKGDFIEPNGYAKSPMIALKHHNWEIIVDYYAENNNGYTRVRIPVVNTSNIRLTLYKENFLSSIGKVLGTQDILIGNKQFDDKFMIKGNNDKLITQLFSNEHLRELVMLRTGSFSLAIREEIRWLKKSFPTGVDEIHFVENGKLNDSIDLKELIELFRTLLDTLLEIEAISSKDAGISLKE
ncbi:MAG: hypothetical protein GY827_09515 [Cytophagales bacterium]|nr:hypothetical protein [Cytophagales bacterium]